MFDAVEWSCKVNSYRPLEVFKLDFFERRGTDGHAGVLHKCLVSWLSSIRCGFANPRGYTDIENEINATCRDCPFSEMRDTVILFTVTGLTKLLRCLAKQLFDESGACLENCQGYQ